MKAYIKGDWKLLRLPEPMGSGEWELYNLKQDPAESEDLSEQHPKIKSELLELWNIYAKQNEVYDHNGHYDSLYRQNYMPEEVD